MALTFNPPPNWPRPPASWTPPAGWRPDPAWGPAPDGWQLWVDATSGPAPQGFAYGPADPAYVAPSPFETTPAEQVVGVVMVLVPLFSCGILACVPSIWVAVKRRSNTGLLVRALVTAGFFLAVTVVGAVLVSFAPTDDSGTPTGLTGDLGVGLVVAGGVAAAVVAALQRRPKDALR